MAKILKSKKSKLKSKSGSSSKSEDLAVKSKKKKKKIADTPDSSKKKSKPKSSSRDEKPSKKSGSGKLKKIKSGDKSTKKAKKIIACDVKPIKNKQNRKEFREDIIGRADLQEVLGKKIELTERQEAKIVQAVINAIEENILGHVVKGGSGTFSFTNLFKIVTKHVPAKPKRKGINPFTKVEQWFEAKPATTRVKARPMKRLKDAAL